MVAGFVTAALLVRTKDNYHATVQETFHFLQQATNFALRSAIGKRMSSEPKLYSTKIAFLVIVLVGFLLISLYRAMLVAYIAVEIGTPPIKSLKDLQNSKYRLAVQKDTAEDALFQNSVLGSDEKKLQDSKKILRFKSDIATFMDEMLSKENQDLNVILFHIYDVVQFSKHFPCNIAHIPNGYQKSNQNGGFIFRKNWPFTGLINHYLLIMKEKGVLHRFHQPYITKTKTICPSDQIIRPMLTIPKSVGINTTVVLYLILLLGFLCASILLLIEKLVFQKYCLSL